MFDTIYSSPRLRAAIEPHLGSVHQIHETRSVGLVVPVDNDDAIEIQRVTGIVPIFDDGDSVVVFSWHKESSVARWLLANRHRE